MQTYSYLFATFILLFSISKTNAEVCGVGEISISPLGRCKALTDFLTDEDLNIKTEHLIYLASNNEGKIEKDNYSLEIFKLNDTKLQSHNKRKSRLYIPDSCLEQLEDNTEIKLDRNKGIVIFVQNSNQMNKNNIPDQYFVIRHNSPGSSKKFINSKTFDFSLCHKDPILLEDEISIDSLRYDENDDTPINIDTILYGRKFGIDLFDPGNEFFSDICFKFRSEKGTDVTLDSRLEDYYQNVTFCDDQERSHYIAYNYSTEKRTFSYRCAFGYFENEDDKSGYLDKIDKELKSLISVSNIKVINCYRKFLNIRDIIRNYGGMICILVLIIQIVCFLIFCFCGIKPIEQKLDSLFILGNSILKRLSSLLVQNTEKDNLIDGQPKKKFNLWGTIRKIIQKKKEEREKLEKEKKLNKVPNGGNNNPPKKRKSIKATNNLITNGEELKMDDIQINIPNEKNDNGDNNHRHHNKKKSTKKSKKLKPEGEANIIKVSNFEKDNNDINNNQKRRKSIQRKSLNPEGEANLIKISDVDETKINNDNKNNDNNSIGQNGKKDKKNKVVQFKDNAATKETPEGEDAKKKKEEEEEKKTQIYDYENDELNELPFKRALKYDKRGFCKYYWNILMFSHIILNVFFRHNDYNLFAVKLGLLFMTFPINLTFNIFFYTNKAIKINYANALDDISGFWKSISNSIFSSLLSTTLLIILKFICLTHNSVRVLRKYKDLNMAKKKSVCVLRCIKIRVTIYYILSLAFLAIFGYYILCFCAIFENTQKELVKSTFTSWLISLIYPFIFCFITSIFRALAFKCKNRILYFIKLMLQFL